MSAGRKAELHDRLRALQRAGVIVGVSTYAPGDRRGRRWVLTPIGDPATWGERVLSTREAEMFALGAEAALNDQPRPIGGSNG